MKFRNCAGINVEVSLFISVWPRTKGNSAQKQTDVLFLNILLYQHKSNWRNLTWKLMHLLVARKETRWQDNTKVLSSYLLAQPGRGCSHQRIPQRWWSSPSPRSRCSDWDLPRQGGTPRHLSVLTRQRWHLLARKEAGKRKKNFYSVLGDFGKGKTEIL